MLIIIWETDRKMDLHYLVFTSEKATCRVLLKLQRLCPAFHFGDIFSFRKPVIYRQFQ